MPFDLILFDCDGVLVDSEPIGVQVDLEVLSEFGLNMSEADVIRRFVGRSSSVLAETIESHIGRKLPAEWPQEYQARRHAAFEAGLRPVSGIDVALDNISYPTCVASSSSIASIRHKLSITGLYERFAGRIFSGDQVANGKPSPELFLYAARENRAEPRRCIVVEDSAYGIEAGQRASMGVLAYVGGSIQQEVPREVLTFRAMRDLPGLIERFEPETVAR